MDEIAQALDGHYRDEQVFILQQALSLFNFYNQQIEGCDEALEKHFQIIESKIDLNLKPLKKQTKQTRNTARNISCFNLRKEWYRLTGTDLTRIDGINTSTALKVIS